MCGEVHGFVGCRRFRMMEVGERWGKAKRTIASFIRPKGLILQQRAKEEPDSREVSATTPNLHFYISMDIHEVVAVSKQPARPSDPIRAIAQRWLHLGDVKFSEVLCALVDMLTEVDVP